MGKSVTRQLNYIIKKMFGRNLDSKYALKEELEDVRNCLQKLQTETVEIKTGINIAKWLLAGAIAVIPVITNIIQYLSPSRIPQIESQSRMMVPQNLIRLPDGTYYDTSNNSVINPSP